MTNRLFLKMNYSIFGRTQVKQEDIMQNTEIEDRLESFTEDILQTIRNGSVSGDTKLIAKSLILLSVYIEKLTQAILTTK